MSFAIVNARTSRLVIVPSFSKNSSGNPATLGSRAASEAATHSTAKVLKDGTSWSQLLAIPAKVCSLSPPIAEKTVSFDSPNPRIVKNSAISPGVLSPVVKINKRCSG